jgi:hypothetical protein
MESDKIKSNSSSSVYVTGTITNPDLEKIIKSVSYLIQSYIIENIKDNKTSQLNEDYILFDEENYLNIIAEQSDINIIESIKIAPKSIDIYNFIKVNLIYYYFRIYMNQLS